MGHQGTAFHRISEKSGRTLSIFGAGSTMLSLILVSCSIRNGIGISGLTKVLNLSVIVPFYHLYRTDLDDPIGRGLNPVVSISNTT